jgi:hypothetical protein
MVLTWRPTSWSFLSEVTVFFVRCSESQPTNSSAMSMAELDMVVEMGIASQVRCMHVASEVSTRQKAALSTGPHRFRSSQIAVRRIVSVLAAVQSCLRFLLQRCLAWTRSTGFPTIWSSAQSLPNRQRNNMYQDMQTGQGSSKSPLPISCCQ